MLKDRGVVYGRVSERGGCFQCFDPFLLNLELQEQACYPPELATADREPPVKRHELAARVQLGKQWREGKRLGSGDGRREGTPPLPHWVWLPEDVTLNPVRTLSVETPPPSCSTSFPSQIVPVKNKKKNIYIYIYIHIKLQG